MNNSNTSLMADPQPRSLAASLMDDLDTYLSLLGELNEHLSNFEEYVAEIDLFDETLLTDAETYVIEG